MMSKLRAAVLLGVLACASAQVCSITDSTTGIDNGASAGSGSTPGCNAGFHCNPFKTGDGSTTDNARTWCTACGAGYAQSSASSRVTECTSCTAGHHTADASGNAVNTQGVECRDCLAGQYQDATHATACKTCARGYSSSAAGAIICTQCQAGTFAADASGNPKDAASTSSGVGAVQCAACAAGRHQSSTGQSDCIDCSSGHASATTGQTQNNCPECGTGKFASDASGTGVAAAAVKCSDCPAGEFALAGQTTCTLCPKGRYSTSGSKMGCKDINGCAGNPCGAGGTCVDKLAPQNGFTCKCKVGFAGNKCADINGCAGNKCKSKDQAAVCSDVKAPGVGNTCKCSNGFSVHKGASNTQECIDVNGCEGHTCNAAGDAKATCADVPAPSTGFTCKCSSGFSDEGDGKCAEINGCALPELGDPCKHGGDEGATCTDSKAPATGNTCTCSKGFKSEEKDGVTKCVANDCLVAAEAAIKQIQGDVVEANTNVDNEATNWEEKARKCTLDQGSIDAAQKKLAEAEDDLEDAKQALSDAENAKLDSCKAGLSLGQLEKLMKDDAFPAQLGPNGAFADAYKAVEEAKKEADAAPKVVDKMKDVVAATTTAAQGAYETCKCDAKDGFDKAWQNAKESHEGTADERKNAMLREKKTICAAENAGKADACDNLELSAEDLASLDLTEPKFPADIELKCEAPATEAPTTDEPVPEAPSSTEAPTRGSSSTEAPTRGSSSTEAPTRA